MVVEAWLARAAAARGGHAALDTPTGSWSYAELLAAAQAGAGELSARGATHDLDAVALLIHTSGTTAAPREVELTYGNVLWSAFGSAVALGAPPHERWLSAMPLSHVGGISILLRSAIASTTAVVHERF